MFKRGKADKEEKSQWEDAEPFFDGAASDDAGADAPAAEDAASHVEAPVDAAADETAATDDAPAADEPAADESAGDESADDEQFPAPHELKVEADEVPTKEDDLDADNELPFDEDDAFAPDDEVDEFLDGSDTFVDDSHEDYYDYGDRKHGVNDAVAAAPITETGVAPAKPAPVGAGPKHGKHGQPKSGKAAVEEMPEHQRKSRRTRKILIAIVILLIFIIIGIGYIAYTLIGTSNQVASQQPNQNTPTATSSTNSDSMKDASTTTTKKTTVPSLTTLMGKTQEQAIAAVGHGARATLAVDVNEEGNPVKKRVNVALEDEHADTKSGTPTVYLGLNEDGTVVMAGYSAPTSSLGYGTLSFADAVSNEHIVEKTLNEAGLNVADGTVTLPAKSTYSTYASDGTTLVKENCTFNGSASVNGANFTWSSVLIYDYTAANASGNLADTVRQIYVYINAA